MRCLIVLVDYHGASDTIECLESLLRMRGDFDVVVCDNGDDEHASQQVSNWSMDWASQNSLVRTFEFKKWSSPLRKPDFEVVDKTSPPVRRPWLSWIRCGVNGGFAAGCNTGLLYGMEADYDIFWLLNNDTIVEPDALDAVCRFLEDDSYGMVGTTVAWYRDPTKVQCYGGATYIPCWAASEYIGYNGNLDERPASLAVEDRLDMILGASMIVTRRYLESVGLLDESYFLYFEELDWAARNAGRFGMGYVPDAIVYHKHGATIGTLGEKLSRTRIKYLFGNKLMFTQRYYKRFLFSVRMNILFNALRAVRWSDWVAVWELAKMAIGKIQARPAKVPAITVHAKDGAPRRCANLVS